MTARGEAAEHAAREARDHPVMDALARAGLVVYGVVYLLIGWLAAQLALGDPAGSASGAGALEEIAQKPFGALALWLAAAGLAALALWQCFQTIGGHRDDDGVRRWLARVGSASRAVVCGTLAVLAVRTALGDAGDSGGGATGSLMSKPFGPLLVLAAAAVVLVVAGASAYRGLGDRWRHDLEVEGRTGEVGRLIEVVARVGHLSRAVAFGVIGVLLVRAALEHDPSQSGGLDQAIFRFRDDPAGTWLIVAVAIGLACYGAFHLVRAWYLRSE